jgi:hypothetical protein
VDEVFVAGNELYSGVARGEYLMERRELEPGPEQSRV